MYKLTPEQIVEIARDHIRMFERRIASKSPNVRVEECLALLAVWKSVEEKKGQNLDGEERGELSDAIESGEYDYMLERNKK